MLVIDRRGDGNSAQNGSTPKLLAMFVHECGQLRGRRSNTCACAESNRPGFAGESLLDTSYLGWGVFKMVVGLPFRRGYVPYGFEEPPVVEPVDVFEVGVLDLVPVFPWRPLVDEFGLVQADH